MISQTAEYALRVVVLLGNRPRRPCTAAQIAEGTAAPSGDLAMVLKGLCRAGIVDLQHGLDGGFLLTKDPNDLTVLDVVTAVDAFHRIEDCPLGQPGQTSGLCPLHRRMDNVMAADEGAFGETTIGDLLQEPGLLCGLPCISEPTVSVAGLVHQ